MSAVLEALSPAEAAASCVVGAWLGRLTDAERDGVVDAIAAGTVHGTYRALAEGGVRPSSESAWYRHFTRLCCCPR